MAVGDNSECFMRRMTYSMIHYENRVNFVCWKHTVWMAAALGYLQCWSGQAFYVGQATEKSKTVSTVYDRSDRVKRKFTQLIHGSSNLLDRSLCCADSG